MSTLILVIKNPDGCSYEASIDVISKETGLPVNTASTFIKPGEETQVTVWEETEIRLNSGKPFYREGVENGSSPS